MFWFSLIDFFWLIIWLFEFNFIIVTFPNVYWFYHFEFNFIALIFLDVFSVRFYWFLCHWRVYFCVEIITRGCVGLVRVSMLGWLKVYFFGLLLLDGIEWLELQSPCRSHHHRIVMIVIDRLLYMLIANIIVSVGFHLDSWPSYLLTSFNIP